MHRHNTCRSFRLSLCDFKTQYTSMFAGMLMMMGAGLLL